MEAEVFLREQMSKIFVFFILRFSKFIIEVIDNKCKIRQDSYDFILFLNVILAFGFPKVLKNREKNAIVKEDDKLPIISQFYGIIIQMFFDENGGISMYIVPKLIL